MYDIRQFKPALYLLLFVGVSGFALAAQWPGVWVLAVGGILLNGWLVKTGRFTPMPRLLASIVTILAFVYIADLVLHSSTTPILIIGQFLVLLQLVKLYEQRANRDYAQLIVLSLLLMVAAAINTASLLFGLMFIAYLFLSLYVCLLFHLKVESEEARKAIALPEVEPNPATLRQDQRHLSSSMRRLTGLISTVAVLMAIAVFLFFPRGTGASMLGPLQFRPNRALTGFSEQVGFQQVARIAQNNELVAHVQVWHDDKLVTGTQGIYLRGLTLDYYNGAATEQQPPGPGRWARAPFQWTRMLPPPSEVDLDGNLQPVPPGASVYRQKINLQPTGSNILFTIGGAAQVKSARRGRVVFSPYDQSLRIDDGTLQQPLEYEVVSTGQVRYREVPPGEPLWRRRFGPSTRTYAERPLSRIDPRIAEYARRPEVSGRDASGTSLVELREKHLAARSTERSPVATAAAIAVAAGLSDPRIAPLTPYDEPIARAMVQHFRSTFSYTLDLTDAERLEGQDPMVSFLYDLKRGHCEYFAGAMTLMCQSLGIPARMVIGFYCDDFNQVGEFYRVEQSQAHAWVEVRGGPADAPLWVTFDPTSGREDLGRRAVGLWSRVRHMFDYLEHTWATNVIAYDRGSRDNLVQNLENQLTSTAVSSSAKIGNFPNWLRTENWAISSKIITLLIAAAVFALVISIGIFLYERWRLWRRAARIGLENLPSEERLRLVRQLGFYENLLVLLERRGIRRPPHLTPKEFGDSLAFLPAEAYHAIRRITEVFYRIRYGRQQLSPGLRQRLDGVIAGIERTLGPAPAASAGATSGAPFISLPPPPPPPTTTATS